MESFDIIEEPVLLSSSGRKGKRLPDNSARAVAKKARHSGDGKNPSISCAHNIRDVCVASTLSAGDLSDIKGRLYSTEDKVKQDAILLSCMDIQQCKRRRRKVEDINKQKARDVTVKYFLLRANEERIPVCKDSFLSILCVKKDRVSNIAKYWLTHGIARPEKRGGARNMEENISFSETVFVV